MLINFKHFFVWKLFLQSLHGVNVKPERGFEWHAAHFSVSMISFAFVDLKQLCQNCSCVGAHERRWRAMSRAVMLLIVETNLRNLQTLYLLFIEASHLVKLYLM